MKHSVLLDTSFFIRLLNDEDPLHKNAKDFFRYFLEQEYILKISTISIAEYCVRGKVDDLPLKNIQIIPFNLDHAKKTGELAKIVFSSKGDSKEALKPRAIIPNDSKLFAQADLDPSTTHFITSDARSIAVHKLLSKHINVRFQIIDIHNPYHETFGVLDLN